MTKLSALNPTHRARTGEYRRTKRNQCAPSLPPRSGIARRHDLAGLPTASHRRAIALAASSLSNEKGRAARATRRIERETLSLPARPVLEVWATWIVISPRRWSIGRVHGAPPVVPVVIAILAKVPHTRVGVRRDRKRAKHNCHTCKKSKDSVHHWLLRCRQPAFSS